MVYIQRTNVTVLQKVSSVFQKGCKLSSTGCICSRSERVQTQASLQCVCVCVCVCMYFVCCKYMAHKHHVEHIFSCFYREIYSKSCYSLSKKCSRFVFSVLFESLHSKATSLISPIIPILSFPTQREKKKKRFVLYMSLSVMSFLLPTLCLLSLPGSDSRVPHHSLWPLAGWRSSLAGLRRFPPAG